MTLADFIIHDMEPILTEWEEFARTRSVAGRMTAEELRDHARQILEAIALDLTQPQTADGQSEKSKGRAPIIQSAPETAAQTHAVLRAKSGFDINQLAAEYRALRASVLRLWLKTRQPSGEKLQDVIRFNEAIDQALAESIDYFSDRVNRARNLLLGMLGHDMRTPLNAVVLTAQFLTSLNAGDDVKEAADSLIRSGSSMRALLDDLMDFSRTKLGVGINVKLEPADLAVLCEDEIKLQLAAHPGRHIPLKVTGDAKGIWDPSRLRQVIRNLISNAVKYGSKETAVNVLVEGGESNVVLAVQNFGPSIDTTVLNHIFDPLVRGTSGNDLQKKDGSLGLGLFIVREVVHSHHGEVTVRSGANETVFTVRLPKYQSKNSRA